VAQARVSRGAVVDGSLRGDGLDTQRAETGLRNALGGDRRTMKSLRACSRQGTMGRMRQSRSAA